MRAREPAFEQRTIFSAGPRTYRVIHQASSPLSSYIKQINSNFQVYLKKTIFLDTKLDFSYIIQECTVEIQTQAFQKRTVHF